MKPDYLVGPENIYLYQFFQKLSAFLALQLLDQIIFVIFFFFRTFFTMSYLPLEIPPDVISKS